MNNDATLSEAQIASTSLEVLSALPETIVQVGDAREIVQVNRPESPVFQRRANVGDNTFSPFDSSWIDSRNNLGYTLTTNVEFTATASDFEGAIPPLADADDADAGDGPGSAFDMTSTSSLVGAGSSVADLDLYINNRDISQRTVPSTPNPGSFQP